MRGALFLVALAASGCTYRTQSYSDCVARHVPSGLRALPEIRALVDPPPERLESGFVLCSTREERLVAAGEALGAKGYSSYVGAAELGKCLRVARTMDSTAEAVEREVSAMCEVAAEHRIAYLSWQAEVGGRSVSVSTRDLRIDGRTLRWWNKDLPVRAD